jgi:hypothetical protein
MEVLNKIAVRDRVLVLVALAMSAFALLHAWLVRPNPASWDVSSSVSLGPLLFLGFAFTRRKGSFPARGFGLLGVHSFHLLLAARHHRRFRPTVLRDRTFRLDIPAGFTNS